MAHHRLIALAAGMLAAATLVVAPSSSTAATPTVLTNLAHLDYLTATVAPPAQPGHTTYRLAHQPAVGVL